MHGSNVSEIEALVSGAFTTVSTFLDAEKAAHPDQTANNLAIDAAVADLGFFIMVALKVMASTNPSKLERISRAAAIQVYMPKGNA